MKKIDETLCFANFLSALLKFCHVGIEYQDNLAHSGHLQEFSAEVITFHFVV